MSYIVFYDGECGLCDRIVQVLLKADRKKVLKFAPLQGETAAKLLKTIPEVDSMVLAENGKIYVKSEAALRTAWLVGGGWAILGSLYFAMPRFIGDFFYDIVARNRHRFFSSSECILPPPGEGDRFLR